VGRVGLLKKVLKEMKIRPQDYHRVEHMDRQPPRQVGKFRE
jgi:hypothetical protein